MIKVSLIAAFSNNYVIGYKGDLPWHIPEDFKLFKEITKGKPVIMGRKTWESLPKKPLPNRTNIIVSRNFKVFDENVFVCDSLSEAVSFATSKTQEEVFIIGGAQLYKQALDLNYVTHMYLSCVKKTVEGDTYFPKFNEDDFKIIEERNFDEFIFRIYEKHNYCK